MDFEDSTPAERSLKVDLTGFSLDGNPRLLNARAASLVKKFPMKLQRFYSSSSADNPAKDTDTAPVKDGYVPVTSDANSDTPWQNRSMGSTSRSTWERSASSPQMPASTSTSCWPGRPRSRSRSF